MAWPYIVQQKYIKLVGFLSAKPPSSALFLDIFARLYRIFSSVIPPPCLRDGIDVMVLYISIAQMALFTMFTISTKVNCFLYQLYFDYFYSAFIAISIIFFNFSFSIILIYDVNYFC